MTASTVQVPWTRPTFATFGQISVLCGFCAGIPVGIEGFVESLFGVETEAVFVIWQFQGIRAGVLGIVLAPAIFSMLGGFAALLFPLFRLGVMAWKGPKLYFRAESDQALYLSRLRLRSYVKLSAMVGFLAALFCGILLIVVMATSKVDDYSVVAVPLLFHGAARLAWVVLATPLLYGLYSALLGIFAFVPFRLFTRMMGGAAIPSREALSCQ